MRRSLLVALAIITVTNTATAKDMNGKFGVGYTQTIGGVGGFAFRYWATQNIGIELDFGLSFVNSDGDRSTTEFVAAVGLFLRWFGWHGRVFVCLACFAHLLHSHHG